LPVVVEVESGGAKLFDVDVEILNEDKTVKQGGRVNSKILLFNLGVTEEIDVDIEYSILDLDGNVIASETEKEIIETQFQKLKELCAVELSATKTASQNEESEHLSHPKDKK